MMSSNFVSQFFLDPFPSFDIIKLTPSHNPFLDASRKQEYEDLQAEIKVC